MVRNQEQKEADPGVEGLFFELSNEDRFSILRQLEAKDLKMADIARAQDFTAAEAFRQLQRMSDSSLIQRRPEGAYGITEYGKLVLQMSAPLEFLFKHKDYFLTHDLSRLPRQFLGRLGELSKAELSTDAMSSLNNVEKIVAEAGEYLWGCALEMPGPSSLTPMVMDKIPKGVKFRFIVKEVFLPTSAQQREAGSSIEWRALEEIPMNLMLNEKEANVGFGFVGGKSDFSGFNGTDPLFHNWTKDLFSYCWNVGRYPIPRME